MQAQTPYPKRWWTLVVLSVSLLVVSELWRRNVHTGFVIE